MASPLSASLILLSDAADALPYRCLWFDCGLSADVSKDALNTQNGCSLEPDPVRVDRCSRSSKAVFYSLKRYS
jgi:hypothetical protein